VTTPAEDRDSDPDVEPSTTPAVAEQRPRPKIDAADAFALAGRLGTSLILSTLAGLLIILGADAQTKLAGGLTALVAVVVFFAAVRLIFKMRAENPEYIAWRVAEDEARRAKRQERPAR